MGSFSARLGLPLQLFWFKSNIFLCLQGDLHCTPLLFPASGVQLHRGGENQAEREESWVYLVGLPPSHSTIPISHSFPTLPPAAYPILPGVPIRIETIIPFRSHHDRGKLLSPLVSSKNQSSIRALHGIPPLFPWKLLTFSHLFYLHSSNPKHLPSYTYTEQEALPHTLTCLRIPSYITFIQTSLHSFHSIPDNVSSFFPFIYRSGDGRSRRSK